MRNTRELFLYIFLWSYFVFVVVVVRPFHRSEWRVGLAFSIAYDFPPPVCTFSLCMSFCLWVSVLPSHWSPLPSCFLVFCLKQSFLFLEFLFISNSAWVLAEFSVKVSDCSYSRSKKLVSSEFISAHGDPGSPFPHFLSSCCFFLKWTVSCKLIIFDFESNSRFEKCL